MIRTSITIEKNIPIPDNRKLYPFSEMEIGDSFFIPMKIGENNYRQKQKVHLAVWRFHQRHSDKKFTTASEDNGIRIWRIR